MKVGVLGTGDVGRTIATKLVSLDHEVMLGSRTADNANAAEWVTANGERASQGTFSDAADFGELMFNCTAGAVSLQVIASAGVDALANKTIIDVANPLDFSAGFPPKLTVCNDDSLAEQIQKAAPNARVVKAFNTMNCNVMVDPSLVPGEHDVFICGHDEGKKQASELIRSFGWNNIVDLGDISAARGLEAYLLLWVRLYGALDTGVLNIHVTKA